MLDIGQMTLHPKHNKHHSILQFYSNLDLDYLHIVVLTPTKLCTVCLQTAKICCRVKTLGVFSVVLLFILEDHSSGDTKQAE